jgi:hypothetical protein
VLLVQQVVGVLIVDLHEGDRDFANFVRKVPRSARRSSSSKRKVSARGMMPRICQVSAPDIVKVFPDPDCP